MKVAKFIKNKKSSNKNPEKLEDLMDCVVSDLRSAESSVSWEEVKKNLREKGNKIG